MVGQGFSSDCRKGSKIELGLWSLSNGLFKLTHYWTAKPIALCDILLRSVAARLACRLKECCSG